MMKIFSVFMPCVAVLIIGIVTSTLQQTARVRSYSRHRTSPQIQARMDRARQLLMQGQQARVAGDLGTAEIDLKKCLQYNTVSNQFAREELAKVYEAEGRTEEALQNYHEMLHPSDGGTSGTWGTDGFTLIHYAAALNDAGRWSEAVQAYEDALRSPNMPDNQKSPPADGPRLDTHFNPAIPQPQTMRAMLYVVLGRRYGRNYKEALPQFEQAVAIDPNLAIAHFYKGYALRGQGQFTQAQAAFQRAAQLDTEGTVKAATEENLRAVQAHRR